jgi:hypothetical protein
MALAGKYHALVDGGAMSASELDLAARTAMAELVDIEEVLVRDFKIRLQHIGAALALHFGVPYEPFRAERQKPVFLLKNLKAQFVEDHHWLPLDEDRHGLQVLALDPERVQASRIVKHVFPKSDAV